MAHFGLTASPAAAPPAGRPAPPAAPDGFGTQTPGALHPAGGPARAGSEPFRPAHVTGAEEELRPPSTAGGGGGVGAMRVWTLLLLGALRLDGAPARNVLLLLGERPGNAAVLRGDAVGHALLPAQPRLCCPRGLAGPGSPRAAGLTPRSFPRSGRWRLRERCLQQLGHPDAQPGRAGTARSALPERLHLGQQLLAEPGQRADRAAPGGHPLPGTAATVCCCGGQPAGHRPTAWPPPVCSTRMGCTGCTRACTTSTPSTPCAASPGCSAKQTSAQVGIRHREGSTDCSPAWCWVCLCPCSAPSPASILLPLLFCCCFLAPGLVLDPQLPQLLTVPVLAHTMAEAEQSDYTWKCFCIQQQGLGQPP